MYGTTMVYRCEVVAIIMAAGLGGRGRDGGTLTGSGSGVTVFLSRGVEESKTNLRILHCSHPTTADRQRERERGVNW